MSRKHNRFFTQFAILTGCFFAVLGIISIKTAIASMGGPLTMVEPYPLPAVGYMDDKDQPVPISNYQGKVVVLHFWASWCPPCVQEMPRMEKLAKSLEDSNFIVIPLSLDRDKAAIQVFNDEHQMDMPLWLDSGSRAMNTLKLRGLPSTMIIDHKGQVVAIREGAVDWVSGEVRSLLWNMIEQSKKQAKTEANPV